MPLTAKQFFEQHGYIVAPARYNERDLERIRTHFDAVLSGQYETGQAPHGIDSFGVPAVMVKVSNAWWSDHVIRHVVTDLGIATMAAELLGVPELYLWADSLYWKAPKVGTEQAKIGWHQDRRNWPFSSTDNMITACVALYDANDESGGLHFADGSHKWGLVESPGAFTGAANEEAHLRPRVPDGEEWRDVCPAVKAGGITFHHCLTFHGSGANWSPTPRRSITIHMIAGDGTLVQPFNDPQLDAEVAVGAPIRGSFFPKLFPEDR